MSIDIGDPVDILPGVLFGDARRHRGVVTAIATDGMVTAEFPQPPHDPMTLTGHPDFFIPVTSSGSTSARLHAAEAELASARAELDLLRAQLARREGHR